GEFSIRGVTPGSYLLTATLSQGDQRYSAGKTIDVLSEDIGGVNLTIGLGATLFGRVRTLGERKVDLRAFRVQMAPDDNTVTPVRSFEIAQDGGFTLTGIAEGQYTLTVSGATPAGFYTTSVRNGSDEVFDSGIRVTGGQGIANLDVVLDPSGGVIEGNVV